MMHRVSRFLVSSVSKILNSPNRSPEELFSHYHNIPQITFVGLKTLILNVPVGLEQGISSPDFGWKQGILSPEYIISSVNLLGAGLIGHILKLSSALSLNEPLNLSLNL